MNKSDIVARVAQDTGLTKAESEKAVNAFLDAVTSGLKNRETVQIIGFGTFSAKLRHARIGTRPGTDDIIEIPSKWAPTFKAGKSLKETLNG